MESESILEALQLVKHQSKIKLLDSECNNHMKYVLTPIEYPIVT